MLNKKVKSRILFFSVSSFLAVLIIFLVLKSLEKNVVYFFSPTEIFYDKDGKIYWSGNYERGVLTNGGSIKSDIPFAA